MNEQEIVATEEDMTELVDSIGVPMPGEREALKFPHLSAKCSKVFQSCKSCPEFLQSAKSKTREERGTRGNFSSKSHWNLES